MKTKQKIIDKIKETETLLANLEYELNNFKEEKTQEVQKIIYNDKEFRIYIWKKRQLKDFPMPKEFDFAKYLDFVELVNKKKLIGEVWKDYFTKTSFKHNKYWIFAKTCFFKSGDWCSSDNSGLSDSSENGRVVVSRRIK